MAHQKISAVLNDTIKNFADTETARFPVFAPSQQETINLIDNYWLSKYYQDSYDERGERKVFYNISTTPVWVAAKMIDLDVRDIRAIPESGQPLRPVLFFERDLTQWMKEERFGKFLNAIALNYPKYGTSVVKRTFDGKRTHINLVHLQNFKVNTTAEFITKSNFVIEIHPNFTKSDLEKKKGIWDDSEINRLLKWMKQNNKDSVRLFEGFMEGIVPGKNYFIVPDIEQEIVLYSDIKDVDDVYKELHWDKIPGRWLARGQMELVFEDQIHMNWLAYLKARGLEWTSKHLWQTMDEGIARNNFADYDDGQVIRTRGDRIHPVQTEERNLNAYVSEENRWEFNLQRKTFATDIVRGVRPPAGTPLGSAVLASQMTAGFFSFMQENFAMFIKDLIWDWIIPDFKKIKSKAHKVNFVGASEEQLKRFLELEENRVFNEKFLKYWRERGRAPDSATYKLLQLEARKIVNTPSHRFGDVRKNLYDDIKFNLDISIVGESADVQGKITALQVALQNTQDPRVQQELINRLLTILGTEPIFEKPQLDIEEVSAELNKGRASPPRIPTPPPLPMAGAVPERI